MFRKLYKLFVFVASFILLVLFVIAISCARLGQRAYRFVTVKPHRYLVARNGWFAAFHRWRFQRFATLSMLFIYLVGVFGVIVLNFSRAFADTATTTWDFANQSEYSLDSGLEFNGQQVRLKAQNYADDIDTAGLYHLDEVNGSITNDSSANANNGSVTGATFASGNLNNGLNLDGINDFVTIPDNAANSFNQSHSIEAWTKLDNSISAGSLPLRQGVVDKGDYQLYYDNETGKLTYEIANSNYGSVTAVAGNDIGGSWDANGKTAVHSTTVMGSNLFAGTGSAAGDAEVWLWDGTLWAMVGGDGLNNSWPDQTYEYVYSLENDGTNVYAGLGSGNGDAEVWRWDGSTWDKIGGDALNSSWAVNTYQLVASMDYLGGFLYAGLGSDNNEAEVWRWNGSIWNQIGGDSLNGGWTTNFNIVPELDNDGTSLYAAIGSDVTEAEVWRYTSGTWTKIGGDGQSSSWNTNYETVRSMTVVSSTSVYAGIGDTADDAEVWHWNGTTWTQIGGDSISGSWGAGYEGVYDLKVISGNLYAGLGTSDGDGEVWQYTSGTWTKIGGDGVNGSWATAIGDVAYTLANYGGTLYAGTGDSGSSGYVYSWDGAAWTVRGGQYINKSWGYAGQGSVETLHAARGNLYAGLGSAAGSAQVWEYNGTTWTMIGGQGINGSWAPNTYELVTSMTSYQGNVIVGLGSSANDGEVWQWNGTTWTQIGGDSLNSGWAANYDVVDSLAAYGNLLYAGLGVTANEAEVWQWNGSTWLRIADNNFNGAWPNNYERVSSMTIYDGLLHVGLGVSAGDGEVWRWSGSTWSKIGGDSLNSSWDNTIEQINSMVVHNNKLYAGVGNSGGDADLWEWNGTTWTQVGGDDINSSWASGTYELVRSMTVYNGDLYVGLGNGAGEGEAWRLSDGAWTKIAGNGVNGGWAGTMEEVESMSNYQGKLFMGTGNTANADAVVWSWGNNGFVQSSASSFDTSWRHVAGTYDGTTAKLFINGVQDGSQTITLTMPNSNRPVLVGTTYGGREQGKSQGFFDGMIDEVRLSSIARSNFTTTPYPTTGQVLSLADPAITVGSSVFEGFSATATGSNIITYRLSNDDGASWHYWNGSTWEESEDTTESNTAAVINANIEDFSLGFHGVRWQAVFDGNGTQQASLSEVEIQSTIDVDAPDTNAGNIQAFRSNGGASLGSNDWTNGSSPYFSWDDGSDAGAGIYGYCLYLGTNASADPVTTKGLLGTSPAYTANHCQFIVTDNEVDFGQPGYIATPMTSSASPYFLRIRAIDKAGNLSATTALFQFRFDNTPPTNPGYITAPSGFINTKATTLTWPTNGGQAPSDAGSGLAGLQYRINNTDWYGDNHTGTGDMSDLLANDGSYSTTTTPDFANINEGINTIYFRTWDQAGNVSGSYVTATLKVNTAGAPSEPQNLQASPNYNTANSFSFDWEAPATYVGDDENSITYCYTVNTLPNSSNCTFTAAGVTSLGSGPYATQPGVNTMYVVARDESSNINYSSFSSVNFTADTAAPGIPTSVDIVDVSIKATSKWRLALTWEEPDDTGSGISSYRVYRSTDNNNFNLVGSSSSTTYIDANLSQVTYYYRVRACDSTNNCGAESNSVSELPTGKFTSPALLTSDPQTSNITTKKATISWTTDRTSDSKVALGTVSGQYGSSEIGNSDQVTAHTLELDNLAAGTTYYYITKWTDEDGNIGTSQEFTFTTSPAPVISEVETTSVGLTTAGIRFTSSGANKINLYYGLTESFGGLKSINTSSQKSQYDFGLDGLQDGVKYFYRLSAFDAEGTEYMGNIFSFSTPPRPRINNLRFQPIEGEPTSTQNVTWNTNVASTSAVSYGKVGGSALDQQSSELKTEHSMKITGLEDDSMYFLFAQSRDKDGNLATSDRQQFRTALDTRPPKVTEINIESSVRGTGAEARGQVIVSWKTDEPSMSQVAFAEGSNAVVFNNKTAEDTELTTDHLVIVSDLPTSKVYSLQPLSRDKSGNVGQGDPQSAIIGRASESVLTIILNTLQRVFGL